MNECILWSARCSLQIRFSEYVLYSFMRTAGPAHLVSIV